MTKQEYLPARETVYKGTKMRSRLEAGFARWLDSWPHLTWKYEPQAFAGAKGQYLPDFVADGFRVTWADGPQRIYFECKPSIFGWRSQWDEVSGDRDEEERGAREEDALWRRMAIIWESDPGALLVLAKQRPGGWADFHMAWEYYTDGDVHVEPVELIPGCWTGTVPAFCTTADPAVPPWPHGYWNGV